MKGCRRFNQAGDSPANYFDVLPFSLDLDAKVLQGP